MCTVSWMHQPHGYQLFCNRDERRTRLAAAAPQIESRDGVQSMAPRDGEAGGTWIAANEFGVSLCLLNGVPQAQGYISRGMLVRELQHSASAGEALWNLCRSSLDCFAPFSLAILQPGRPALAALWNGADLRIVHDADSLMPLVSSSFDTASVRQRRRLEFQHRYRTSRLDPEGLLAFHASHEGGPSAYSTCMHRGDAHTVSFTRISVTASSVELFYSPAAPCKMAPGERFTLERRAA
jgi:hypothetical protein